MATAKIKTMSAKDIKNAYDGSYYTILGAGGDLNEWVEGYQGLLNKEGIGKIKQWYKTTGRVLNDTWGLYGNNRFKQGLTILMFPLEGLNVGKLAIFKLKMNDRWFDDVIDNSVRHSRKDRGLDEEDE